MAKTAGWLRCERIQTSSIRYSATQTAFTANKLACAGKSVTIAVTR